MSGPLAGRVVVTTRDQPGRLDRLLAEAGAIVMHVPLIAIEPIADVAVSLDGAAWLVVTSQHGAAAVGAAGRPADLVPVRQTAADLVESFPAGTGRVVLALGDLAAPTLAEGLRDKGWAADTSVVYRTLPQIPDPDVRAAVLAADAVAFASGSAASAWFAAIGTATPPVVVAIGPTTAGVARSHDLRVTHVAATYDLPGLVQAVVAALA